MTTPGQLDSFYTDQFSWGEAYSPQEILASPELVARIGSSWNDNTYEPPSVPTQETVIDGPLGSKSLRVLVYGPTISSDEPRPALVWCHGGGWLGGEVSMLEADGVARELVSRFGVTVVSVDYHLADGENGYPNLHREHAAAFAWVLDNADDLGVDPAQVSLGGASAGANLTVSAALEMRDAREILPRSLVVAYPVLHEQLPAPGGSTNLAVVPQLLRLPQALISQFVDNYLAPVGGNAPYAMVGDHDLHGLPDVLVLTAEYDDLRGSGEVFASEATAAGVSVTLYESAGSAHGFLNGPPTRLREADHCLNLIGDFVTRI